MREKAKLFSAASLFVVSLAILYSDVVQRLVAQWASDDNYSHGFLVVPIALFFVWERRSRLAAAAPRPSILGLLVVLGSLGMLVVGVLGAELFLTRFSLLGTLAGAIWFIYGWQRVKILAFPLAFLLLMIPIPAIIFNQIAFPLQLLASRFGEALLLGLNVPVLREGNVIVLASTTLEVTEACSGIRSIVSLLALGVVLAYFTDPRLWVRTVITLATIPVAIITNGLRLVGTGLGVQLYGPEAAEAFFHTFSGWLIFVVAFLILFALSRLILWVAPIRREAIEKASVTEGDLVRTPTHGSMAVRALILAICLTSGAFLLAKTAASEAVPIREPLAGVPMHIGKWEGRPTLEFSEKIVAALGVDEYLSRFYVNGGREVHLYIGYYATQRQGSSIHSPQNCLPGAGWQPVQSNRVTVLASGHKPVEINRVLVQKGLDKILVFYWYQSHGRVIASEYWGKVYLVLDAMRMNRTDGALVRVLSPIVDSEEAAEQEAVSFVKALFPVLPRHLPA